MARSRKNEYSEDIFDDTRMSFGEHIEELRVHLIRGLLGLGICLMLSFALDALGETLGNTNIGIGRPMMKIITYPVESQVRNFYAVRNSKAKENLPDRPSDPVEALKVLEKLNSEEIKGNVGEMTTEEKQILKATPQNLRLFIPAKVFEDNFGLKTLDPDKTEIEIPAKVFAAELNTLSTDGETLMETRRYLTTLSAQEAFMVYFKVSLLCGVILSSPWLFFQAWSFVGAGLYPHERKYVHWYLPFSIGLFLSGVALCQFLVLPGAVKALLGFNNWIDMDPDLRLNEWLGFAILLPLVFGLSFQTPLVMFFLNRIGMFSAADYWSKWRYAIFVLAMFAALITPTPDVFTMMYLFVPMFGLYCLGVIVCAYFPPSWADADEDEDQIAV